MRPRTFVMSVVLLLAPTAVFRAAERDEGQGAASVGALVRQLGDDCYSRREAATRALDAIGEPALGALRQAAGSADPEVRRRAALLARRAHHKALTRDQGRLEGVWVGELESEDGKAVTLGGETGLTIQFVRAGGGTVTRQGVISTESLPCTWEVIDATATPPQIDLVFSPTRRYRAIYRLDGDRLTLCGVDRSLSEGQRPTRFEAKEGDGRYLIRLKRARTAPAGPATAVTVKGRLAAGR